MIYYNENCFPNCSTFEKDDISGHYYCIDCGADERNVRAFEDFRTDDKIIGE